MKERQVSIWPRSRSNDLSVFLTSKYGPETQHNASYDDDVRELTEFWYLHKKARCYGNHHQYRLHNFKGCVAALVTDYNLNRQQAIEVLKVCIQLHVVLPIHLTGTSSITKD